MPFAVEIAEIGSPLRKARNCLVKRVQQQSPVGGEVLHKERMLPGAKIDSHRLAVRNVAEKLGQLVVHVHLVGDTQIDDVENDDIQHCWKMLQKVIAIDAPLRRRESEA